MTPSGSPSVANPAGEPPVLSLRPPSLAVGVSQKAWTTPGALSQAPDVSHGGKWGAVPVPFRPVHPQGTCSWRSRGPNTPQPVPPGYMHGVFARGYGPMAAMYPPSSHLLGGLVSMTRPDRLLSGLSPQMFPGPQTADRKHQAGSAPVHLTHCDLCQNPSPGLWT